jgi:hypothetical protein
MVRRKNVCVYIENVGLVPFQITCKCIYFGTLCIKMIGHTKNIWFFLIVLNVKMYGD